MTLYVCIEMQECGEEYVVLSLPLDRTGQDVRWSVCCTAIEVIEVIEVTWNRLDEK